MSSSLVRRLLWEQDIGSSNLSIRTGQVTSGDSDCYNVDMAFDKKAYQQQYYLDNKDDYQGRIKLKRRVYRKILIEIKSFTPCMDCGEQYPYYVMDFDHRPGVDKKFELADSKNISSALRLMEEVDKCDVVCSNCHRIRTHSRLYDQD